MRFRKDRGCFNLSISLGRLAKLRIKLQFAYFVLRERVIHTFIEGEVDVSVGNTASGGWYGIYMTER